MQISSVDTAEIKGDDDGEWIRIRIADSGCGFSLNDFQSENKGNGFGLFNIVERIECIGGRVQIDSSSGHGCCVRLKVPKESAAIQDLYQPSESEKDVATEKSDYVAPSLTNPSGNIRILIVDDHAVMREGLATVSLKGKKALKSLVKPKTGLKRFSFQPGFIRMLS